MNVVQKTGIRPVSGGERGRRRRIFAIAAAAVLLCACGAALGGYLYDRHQHELLVASVIDTDAFYPGIVVQGVDLGGKTMEQAKKDITALEPSLRGKYEVAASYGGKTWTIT